MATLTHKTTAECLVNAKNMHIINIIGQLIKAWWRIYASVNWIRIGSSNGVSLIRRQASPKPTTSNLASTKFDKNEIFRPASLH